MHRRACLILGGIVGPLLPRLACVALAVLAATSVSEAGVSPFWQQLGSSSASGNGVSQTPSPKAVFDGALAVGADGEVLLAWTEGTAWNKGGSAAWQLFDADGQAIGPVGHGQGVAVWGLVAAYARRDGFTILY